MKKLCVLLLIPILAFSLVSCDASMRSQLADVMKKMSGNAWIDAGLVKPSTAGVDEVTNIVTNVKNEEIDKTNTDDKGNVTVSLGGDSTGTGGFEVKLDDSTASQVTTVLKPQTTEEKKQLEDSLSTALKSTTQTKQLVEEMKKEVAPEVKEAATGSLIVASAALKQVADQIKENPPAQGSAQEAIANTLTEFATLLSEKVDAIKDTTDSTTVTQADVVTVQLVTNLVATTAKAVEAIKDITTADPVDLVAVPEVKAAIDDSLFVANVAKQLSGVGSLDIAKIIDLSELMNMLGGQKLLSRDITLSGTPKELPIALPEKAVTYVNQVGKIVVAYVQASSDGTINEKNYKTMIDNLKVSRSATDNAFAIASKVDPDTVSADIKNAAGLTGMMDYMVAVVFSELDKFGSSDEFKAIAPEGASIREILQSILVCTPELLNGTMTKEDKFKIDSTFYDKIEGMDQDTLLGVFADYINGEGNGVVKASILASYDTLDRMSKISKNTVITDNFTRDQLKDWLDSLGKQN